MSFDTEKGVIYKSRNRKFSDWLPFIITLLVHGIILVVLLLEPFSRLTESSVSYITLNTEMMEFVESGGSDAPDFPSAQRKKTDAPETRSVTSTAGSAADASVNLNDTTGKNTSNDFATPDTVENSALYSDDFNYMDFYSGSGGGGKGGSGILAGNMKLPTFMNGDFNVFRSWFLKRFRIPVEAPVNYRERVIVSFSVDKSGKMRNIKVRDCSSSVVEKEIVRVLENAPQWEPGQYNGVKAGFNLQMPVNFK